MASILKAAAPVFALIFSMWIGAAYPARASALLAACSTDIASLCKGVTEGRGRISACLLAHGNKISGSCKPELSKVTSSGTFKRMVPASMKNLGNMPGGERLEKVCAADIKSHCPGVAAGNGRILACLYAWSNRISRPCHAEAKTVIDGLK